MTSKTRLERLRDAKSRSDLASLLGVSPKGLAHTLYKVPEKAKYHTFKIPKRTSGFREICAPIPKLKLLQRRLADLLLDCTASLEALQPNRAQVTHGFQKGRSIVTNADLHCRKRYVLNLDLQDFFGSINFGRVRGFFLKDRHFALSEQVATTIAQIACFQNALPQGSPCSPVLSNLIGHILDVRLLRLAKASKTRYSRYADDITFSTNARDFPQLIAFSEPEQSSVWTLSDNILETIQRAGFEVNSFKTRMQIQGSRQEATGLTINEKVNVRSKYTRQTRAMCHRLFNTGAYTLPSQSEDGASQGPTLNLAPLEGRLAHIYRVTHRIDLSDEDRKEKGIEPPKSVFAMYRDFLFYKHFLASSKPVLVTEGLSDITYIRAALSARKRQFPRLIGTRGNKNDFHVKFFKASATMHNLVMRSTGTSAQQELIKNYRRFLKRYGGVAPTSPVIVIADNDGGAKDLFKEVNKMAKNIDPSTKLMSIKSGDTWCSLGHNLFFMKLPHGGKKSSVEIEDLLPNKWLRTCFDGKCLDRKKPHGDENSLGKVAFAGQLMADYGAKIDFSNFDPLFSMIDEVVQRFARR